MTTNPTTLITGATGKTGRRVADRLARQGWPVRRGSRAGTPRFDWSDPATWPEAVRGAEQIYISFQPDLAVPGAIETIGQFTRLAVENGTKKLVLLSGRGEEAAARCEEIVQRAGVAWTIVRASWFAQNFSEGHFLDPVRSGTVALPAGAVPEPFIDIDDIADVAAAALMSDRHDGQLYEVTGPRLLTFEEAVADISRACGRDVRYVQIAPEEFRRGLVAEGIPDDFADFLVWLFATTLDGRNAHVTDGVERALGRPPRDFSAFVEAAADNGVWRAS